MSLSAGQVERNRRKIEEGREERQKKIEILLLLLVRLGRHTR